MTTLLAPVQETEIRSHVDPRSALGIEIARRLRASGYRNQLSRVVCRCDPGEVVLTGHVPSYYIKQVAQELIRTIDGVQRIHNQLIVPSRKPR